MMERALTLEGVRVTTATTDDNGASQPSDQILKVSVPKGVVRFYGRKWINFYKVSPSLFLWLMRNCRQFDVVHIHALFSFSSLAAAFAAWWHDVPYVIRPLGTLNRYGIKHRRSFLKGLSLKVVEQPILSRAAAVHFTSENEWEEARELGIALHGTVIPLGVEAPGEIDKVVPLYKIAPSQKVILFLSRLDQKKNLEGLIEAFGIILREQPNSLLLVAGAGSPEYLKSLKSLAKRKEVDSNILWLGHIEGDEKWAVFRRADVYVLPSFSENFGIAVVEAMIAGCACVVGRGVAVAADIEKAQAGIITEPEAASIAANIIWMLSDEKHRRLLGERAQKLAEREFSTSMMATRLIKLYTTLMNGKSPIS